ncbi:hypothetical protein GCM10010052_19770 [Paenarthrobacter histidinolovorans]|nr:hypothetical protein GCM10010052_19770 [Paenarthrobacter histidinolovorans]
MARLGGESLKVTVVISGNPEVNYLAGTVTQRRLEGLPVNEFQDLADEGMRHQGVDTSCGLRPICSRVPIGCIGDG